MRFLLALLLSALPLAAQNITNLTAGQLVWGGMQVTTTPSEVGNVGPSISVQPQSVTCITNTTVSFTLTAAGTAPLSYQWRTNSVDLADVAGYSGTLTNTLWVSNVVIGQSNWAFACVVTNAYGAITSEVATLTVTNGTYNAAIIAWANQVVTNGGAAPSEVTKNALDTFYLGLQTDGILTNILACCCFVPDGLTAAITPLIATVGGPIWTNVNFVDGDLTTNGLTGNGSTKYLKTGVLPSNLTYTNVGLSVYGTTLYKGTIEVGEVAADGATACIFCLTNTAGGTLIDLPTDATSKCRLIVARTNSGFFTASRTANNRIVLYQGNSTLGFLPIGTNTQTCSDRMTGNTRQFYAWAYNNNGTTAYYSSNTLSFVSFTTGLTENQSSNLYLRVQALRTALGGGYL